MANAPIKTARTAVSVIIPTYNALALLQQNVPRVITSLRSGDELVIVDDASQDETVPWLVRQYHLEKSQTDHSQECYQGKLSSAKTTIFLTVIRQLKNARFGATVNRGVQKAQHELVFVLNNDAIPQADTLDYLVPHFQDPLMFGVGCLELEGVTHQSQIARYKQNQTTDGIELGGKNRLFFAQGLFQHRRSDDFTSGPTAWASGGSALFDRKKWLELGGFDQLYYPAYWEDIDLSERARRKGWKVWFEARAIVEHRHETTNQTVFKAHQLVKQGWWHSLFFTWRFGTWLQRLQLILWSPYYLLKLRKSLFRWR